MAHPQAEFLWYELMTTGAPAASAFYQAVMGWAAQDAGMGGGPYTLLSVPGQAPLAGLMELPAEACAAGARPGWIGYVGVADVDACAARVQQAGGSVHRAAQDIPGVGRFAVVADPQGAALVLFKGASDMGPAKPAAGTPGYVGWHELHATDGAKAFAFYAELFGWAQGEAIDMGPMGVYQLFTVGGQAIGGMMTKSAEFPVPLWLYYFNVASLDASLALVTAQGGRVLNGPQQVPGGGWIAQCLDPQGALFALVGSQR